MVKSMDIAVVGAGAIGAACALRIAQNRQDLNILTVDRQARAQPGQESNLKVWALGIAATDLLRDAGVLQALDANHCHPYTAMQVWDENSQGELSFSAAELGVPSLGMMVDADVCTMTLQSTLVQQANVECLFSCQPTQLDFGDTGVILGTDAGQYSVKLIIAADGANSWVRQQAGIFAPHHSYQQLGIVAKIATRQPHADTAWQRFLASGPVAVLPLHNQQSSIVWSADNQRADNLLSLSDQDFEQQLEAALESRLGTIKLLSRRHAFPLQTRQAQSYVRANLAIIGDAAHAIHPLAGQGANLGFRDAQQLAELVSNSDDICAPDLLQRYQRQRRAENLQTDFLMTSLHQAFRFNPPLWSLLRGRGMQWVSNNKPLKRRLARHAMGLYQ